MPRIASLSSHGPRGCTLRVTLTALLRLRLKSRQIRADSGRSCRVKEEDNFVSASGPLSDQRPFFWKITSLLKRARFLRQAHPSDTALSTVLPRTHAAAPHTRCCPAHTLLSKKGTDSRLPILLGSLCVGIPCSAGIGAFHDISSPDRPARQRTEIAICLD
jgi:hypothetical protein